MSDKPSEAHRSQDEMLEHFVRLVEKVERTLYGEQNVSPGLIERIKEIEQTATEARRLAAAIEEDRQERQAQIDRFRRFVWPIVVLFIGGAITSIFNFISNFLQTVAGG